MKKVKMLTGMIMMILITAASYGQGFIEPIDPDFFSALYGNPCIAQLESGEIVQGKFGGGTFLNGYLSKISIKQENGEKVKFNPEEVVSLKIKASKLAKLSMMTQSSSIKELTETDFNEIVDREYIVFETALKASKKDKARLMQLLNPGFDNRIKVYADPEANETMGVGFGGIQLTGGADKSYLFVKDGEKAVKVKKKSYRKNFGELYSDCGQMVNAFGGSKIKWDDVAGHVFAFNQICH